MGALVGVLLLATGCPDYRAAAYDELARHPARPDSHFAVSPGAPAAPAPGDWLIYRTHAPPVQWHVMAG
jgi:hypothetical protein